MHVFAIIVHLLHLLLRQHPVHSLLLIKGKTAHLQWKAVLDKEIGTIATKLSSLYNTLISYFLLKNLGIIVNQKKSFWIDIYFYFNLIVLQTTRTHTHIVLIIWLSIFIIPMLWKCWDNSFSHFIAVILNNLSIFGVWCLVISVISVLLCIWDVLCQPILKRCIMTFIVFSFVKLWFVKHCY